MTSLFERDGYDVVRRGGAGDERIDLVLNLGGIRDVVQCKRWKSDIGSATVKEFYDSMLRAGARHGFILTTASFSRGARACALGVPITLIDGTYLASWVSGLNSSRSSAEEKRRSGDGFDPYAVLEVSREAGQEEIREAYVRLVAKHHPDKVSHLGGDLQQIAHEKMLAINRAYTLLTSRPTEPVSRQRVAAARERRRPPDHARRGRARRAP